MEYEIGADESISEAAVRAVSAMDGREPDTLPPLGGVLDPDALDSLFDACSNGEPRVGGRLSFIYGGCHVTVDNGEYLTVRLLENRSVAVSGRDGSAETRG